MKTIITDIPSRKAFLKGEGTLEIGYPWLSFGAIIALESIVNKDYKVLEFGSGGSTVFWAEKCKSVKSFETDPEWFKKVNKRTKEFKNVEIMLITEIFEVIKKEPDNYYDIVLIDSYPKDAQRLLLTNKSISKIKPNGWLIIDNYLKFGMEDFEYPSKWEIYTFDEFRYSGHGTRICRKIQ